MNFDIEVEGDKYKLLSSNVFGNIGVMANTLKIKYDRDENNNFYEEIEGKASFLQDINFGYNSIEFNLYIRKAHENLEESARLNIEDNLCAIYAPGDYILNDCIKTGFSHLSKESSSINCILILEDSIFEKLIVILKSNNLSGFGFYANYLYIYKMLKSEKNKEYYEEAEMEKNIYLFKPKGAKYPDSSFGAVTSLFINSNSVALNQPRQKDNAHLIETSSGELSMTELIRHTGIMANTLIIGFIAIFLLIIFK